MLLVLLQRKAARDRAQLCSTTGKHKYNEILVSDRPFLIDILAGTQEKLGAGVNWSRYAIDLFREPQPRTIASVYGVHLEMARMNAHVLCV